MDTVLPPDVETHVIAHLAAALAVPVEGYRLGDPPGEAVIIRTTGGNRLNVSMWWVQLTATCWGPDPESELAASQLARRVTGELQKAELVGLINGQACPAMDFYAAPYPDPDPVTHRARYSLTFRALMHGTHI